MIKNMSKTSTLYSERLVSIFYTNGIGQTATRYAPVGGHRMLRLFKTQQQAACAGGG
jgi:hypothetical protein